MTKKQFNQEMSDVPSASKWLLIFLIVIPCVFLMRSCDINTDDSGYTSYIYKSTDYIVGQNADDIPENYAIGIGIANQILQYTNTTSQFSVYPFEDDQLGSNYQSQSYQSVTLKIFYSMIDFFKKLTSSFADIFDFLVNGFWTIFETLGKLFKNVVSIINKIIKWL